MLYEDTTVGKLGELVALYGGEGTVCVEVKAGESLTDVVAVVEQGLPCSAKY